MVPDYDAAGRGRPVGELIGAEFSMWRYRFLLPVPDGRPVHPLESGYGVGGTPLVDAPRLAAEFGVGRLWVKDEGRNPTASLKDRASALVVAAAARAGQKVVCTASSGNAAAALAGCCAAADIRCVVFVPGDTAPAKIRQLLAYGAQVFAVRDGYEAAVRLSYQAADHFGWLCRSTAYNPLTAEGKKTAALEIVEQLGFRVPSVVLVPAGDGNILTGLYRGFVDAMRLGWTRAVPRLVAVQSAQSPALHRAWRLGLDDVEAHDASSIAESINVAVPQDGFRALRVLRETGGDVLSVPDSALGTAVRRLAQGSGVFAEPSAAITLAGLGELWERRALTSDDEVVLVSTGSGLKHAAPGAPDDPKVIMVDADLVAVERAMRVTGAGR
ncbi:threonine synthase [Streptomyces sp. NPDC001601]|uniref:threonine synthase n=1 Tax=Streptomyces sp. NPDC001601 TaxID=3364592 RepID=UPI0036AD5E0E